MAISFSLEIYFGNEDYDFNQVKEHLSKKLKTFEEIDFHPINNSFINENGPVQAQLSIFPKNVGIAVSFDDQNQKQVVIDDERALKLTLHMYEFLKELPFFELALAGWELGFLSNYFNRDDNRKITSISDLEGLIIHKKYNDKLVDPSRYVEFDSNHIWIPQTDSIGNLDFCGE